MSWILHRVDDRLIHGQVVIAYGERLHPQRIWVVDDPAAGSSWERSLLLAAAPGVDVRVVRDLAVALELVTAGAAVPSFTLGGLHYAPGKSKVNEYIYLDDRDRSAARALLERGVRLEVQDVPATRLQPLRTLVPELAA